MLRLSHNLRVLPRLSFTHTKISQFQIKEQPHDFCLSTIESTLITLELLNANTTETIETQHLEHFLTPFLRMVEHQISCISDKQHSRSKKFIPPRGKEFSKISV
jgi:DTW domain-containing protein YfiP